MLPPASAALASAQPLLAWETQRSFGELEGRRPAQHVRIPPRMRAFTQDARKKWVGATASGIIETDTGEWPQVERA
jgi:hypothetical protein